MSTIDGVLLRAVRREVEGLIGSRVQDVRDAEPRGLIFELYRPGGGLAHLLASAADPARVHLVSAMPANAGHRSAAGRLFRQRLLGARLLDVEMRGLERVLALAFGRGPRGEEPAGRVVCEATGRVGNVVLVDEAGCVVEALRRLAAGPGRTDPGFPADPGSREAAPRVLWPGLPYVPPGPPAGAAGVAPPEEVDPLLRPEAELAPALSLRAAQLLSEEGPAPAAGRGRSTVLRFLVRLVPGLGPALAREVALAAGLDPEAHPSALSAPEALAAVTDRILALLRDVRAERFAPCRIVAAGAAGPGADGLLRPDRPRRTIRFAALPLTPGPGEEAEAFSSPSALLEAVFAEAARRSARRALLGRLRKGLRDELERAARRLARQEEEWQAALAADDLRHEGELILAHAHAIPRGAARVELPDWKEGGRPRAVELDPRQSPAENAKARFERYRKARRRQDELRPWLQRSREEVARLRTWLLWAETADPEDPDAEGRAAALLEELALGTRGSRSRALSRGEGGGGPAGHGGAAVGRTDGKGRG
ncbi:MAG: NFACT family protein, partial [Clostridia bacterium]|nr:NFACT family protein [Clostridia bacterium]